MEPEEKPVKVVRLSLNIQQHDGRTTAYCVAEDDAGAQRELLSMPELAGLSEQAREEFVRLAATLARDVALADNAMPVVEFPGTGTAPPFVQPVEPGEGEQASGEFEVAVGKQGEDVCAYIVAFNGERAAPCPAGRILSMPIAFMADETVQAHFRSLVEVIGLALARTMAQDAEEEAKAPKLAALLKH